MSYRSTRSNRGSIRTALRRRAGGVSRAQERLSRQILAAALRLVPRRTGKLAGTLRLERGENQNGSYIHVVAGSPDTDYLGFVLRGTTPHMIFPRNAKVLRFQVGGRTVFATKVRHPGTRANNFLQRAFDEVVRRR